MMHGRYSLHWLLSFSASQRVRLMRHSSFFFFMVLHCAFAISQKSMWVDWFKCGLTPRQNRFCTLCNNAGSAQTGDEFHAIMHCPSFAAQRENLRDKVAGHAPLFNKLNEYEQFIFLLTCEGAPACHMGEFSYNVLSAVRKPVWGLNLINTCLSVYDVYIAICWFSLSFCCYVS